MDDSKSGGSHVDRLHGFHALPGLAEVTWGKFLLHFVFIFQLGSLNSPLHSLLTSFILS